jgi:hypothetical protein
MDIEPGKPGVHRNYKNTWVQAMWNTAKPYNR